MLHRVQCSCKLYPLKHRNETLNSVCPTLDCLLSLQHAFFDFYSLYTYTRTNGPLHASPHHVRNRVLTTISGTWLLFILPYGFNTLLSEYTLPKYLRYQHFLQEKKIAVVKNHNLKDSDLFSSVQ